MTVLLDDFKRFVGDSEAAAYYAKWARDNPWDLSRWTAVRDGILTGRRPAVPVMSTKYGAALIDNGVLYLDATPPTPVPPPPPPTDDPVPKERLWEATLEDGTFNEFDGGVQAGPGRATAVTQATALGGPSAPRKGSRFAQFLVKNGDNFVGGERCEALRGQLQAVNGKEWFYGHSVALPADFPVAGAGWIPGPLLADFHSNSGESLEGQANVQYLTAPNRAGVNWAYSAANPGFGVGINGGQPTQSGQYDGINTPTYTSDALDLGALERGKSWFDVCERIVWSDAGKGIVGVYLRPAAGSWRKVAELLNCSNLYRGYSAYLKVGINRAQSSGMPDGFAWFDAVYGPSPAPPAGLPV